MKNRKNRIFNMAIINCYDMSIYFNNRKKYTKYEIYLNDCIIAKTDTEDKARMYADAFEKGFDRGRAKELKNKLNRKDLC